MDLASLQSGLLAALVDARAQSSAPEIRANGLDAARRLAIYRGNLHANWRSALADTFPVVERLVGEAFFTEASRSYAAAHPSRSGDLQVYGAEFPAFLEQYPHARDHPYLGDVARLEWAWHESFHAAGSAPMDLEALAGVPAAEHGELRLHLHPSARLVDSAYPIVAIWTANQSGRDGTPERLAGPDHALVHRPALEVQVQRLEPRDALLLRALAAGEPLEAGAKAAGHTDAQTLGAALQRFVAARVLVGFTAR